MEEQKLLSVKFNKLKGLENIELVFEKPLTAIMGVNGSGKTTVIHALACVYQPLEEKGENHKFPEFFVPNTDSLWDGSSFSVEYEKKVGSEDKTSRNIRKYSKKTDRWSPRYSERPKRDVFYIGIDSCLPEIEKQNNSSKVIYSSKERDDKIAKKVIEAAAGILNKDYELLLENTYRKKHFSGVKLSSGLKYSSLSMGTGEQRTIKLIEVIMKARQNSLILIDEIDLLLHVSSLKNLIQTLYKIAEEKKLQIIFTTHSLDVAQMTDYVGIQYIQHLKMSNGINKSMVYNTINSELIQNLTDSSVCPIKIYVEDNFAKAIVKKVLSILNMSRKSEVITYGSIENAFTIASAKVLQEENIDNTLIILDGDKYRTNEEKLEQIKKKLTGTEGGIQGKRDKAVSIISQFNLPLDKKPEKFFHGMLVECENIDNELIKAATEIQGVLDPHEWIHQICKKLNESETVIVQGIIDIIKDSEKWKDYIQPLENWLDTRRNV